MEPLYIDGDDTKLKEPERKDGSEEQKQTWGNSIEFILATVGYVVGLGNVWRFAYVAYANGGGTFVLAYWCCSAVLGFVLFSMECAVGQFGKMGPIKGWSFIPAFAGLGCVSFLLAEQWNMYCSVIVCWCMFYFVKSFASTLPWTRCNAPWNDEYCDLPYVANCSKLGNFSEINGTCYNSTIGAEKTVVAIFNKTVASSHGIRSVLAAEQYFSREALQETPDINFESLGGLNVPMFGLLLVLHIAFYFVFIFGVRGFGKVVYFTTLVPYMSLSVLLVNGFFIDGGLMGMKTFLIPDLERLADIGVWQSAAIQLFYSLGPVWGTIIGLSSFNKFNNNIVRDSLITCFADACTSMLAGVIIFAYLGHLSLKMGTPIEEVTASGAGLAFVIYPTALAMLPSAPIWSGVFFFTLTVVGISSVIGSHFSFLENILMLFPRLDKSRKHRMVSTALYLGTFVLFGTSFCRQGGFYLLTFWDNSVGGWHLLFIGACEAVILAWIYGWSNMRRAMGMMMPWFAKCKPLCTAYGINIRFVVPTLMFLVTASKLGVDVPLDIRDYTFPFWSSPATHMLRVFTISPLFIGIAFALYKHRMNWRVAFQPIEAWRHDTKYIVGAEY